MNEYTKQDWRRDKATIIEILAFAANSEPTEEDYIKASQELQKVIDFAYQYDVIDGDVE